MIATTNFKLAQAAVRDLLDRRLDRGVILVGTPGSGKTAVLRQLRDAFADRCSVYFFEGCPPADRTSRLSLIARSLHASRRGGQRLLLFDEYDRPEDCRGLVELHGPADVVVLATNVETIDAYMPNYFFTLRLRPFSVEDCQELLAGMDTATGDPLLLSETARALTLAAEGNPRRIVHLLAHLAHSGSALHAVREPSGCHERPSSPI